MDTIFMNSENSKISELYVLVLKLTNKLDLRIGEKVIAPNVPNNILRNPHTITINLKYLHQHGMMNLNYQMDRNLYQIFKIILSIF